MIFFFSVYLHYLDFVSQIPFSFHNQLGSGAFTVTYIIFPEGKGSGPRIYLHDPHVTQHLLDGSSSSSHLCVAHTPQWGPLSWKYKLALSISFKCASGLLALS